jgi:hypothetical protein
VDDEQEETPVADEDGGAPPPPKISPLCVLSSGVVNVAHVHFRQHLACAG